MTFCALGRCLTELTCNTAFRYSLSQSYGYFSLFVARQKTKTYLAQVHQLQIYGTKEWATHPCKVQLPTQLLQCKFRFAQRLMLLCVFAWRSMRG